MYKHIIHGEQLVYVDLPGVWSSKFYGLSDNLVDSSNSSDRLNQTVLSKSLLPSQAPEYNRNTRKPLRRKNQIRLLVNYQSIKKEIADKVVGIDEYKPIFGKESWLNPDNNSSEIFPENYKIYRKKKI